MGGKSSKSGNLHGSSWERWKWEDVEKLCFLSWGQCSIPSQLDHPNWNRCSANYWQWPLTLRLFGGCGNLYDFPFGKQLPTCWKCQLLLHYGKTKLKKTKTNSLTFDFTGLLFNRQSRKRRASGWIRMRQRSAFHIQFECSFPATILWRPGQQCSALRGHSIREWNCKFDGWTGLKFKIKFKFKNGNYLLGSAQPRCISEMGYGWRWWNCHEGDVFAEKELPQTSSGCLHSR